MLVKGAPRILKGKGKTKQRKTVPWLHQIGHSHVMGGCMLLILEQTADPSSPIQYNTSHLTAKQFKLWIISSSYVPMKQLWRTGYNMEQLGTH